MRTIKIDRRRVSTSVLERVVASLKAGAVVVYPTDTAYGLAADPANARAVRRVFAIKGRRAEKQLPLIAGSRESAAAFVRLSGLSLKLAERYWPGPLTIVAPVRGRSASGAGGTAALRVPASVWARALANGLGHPITSTSANLSGRPAIYAQDGIRRSFAGRRHQPDIFLDAGRLRPRPPSTIVKVSRGKVIILRAGPVKPALKRPLKRPVRADDEAIKLRSHGVVKL